MQIEEISLRLEILDALARYCRALDRMDESLFDQVWHPEATVDYAGLYQGSATGLRAYLWETHAAMAMHSHQIANVVIRSEGAEVSSEAYVTVQLWTCPDAEGRQTEVLSRGRYLDRWERGADSVRIMSRVHLADMQTFRTLGSGHTDSGVARDHSDRSYQLPGFA